LTPHRSDDDQNQEDNEDRESPRQLARRERRDAGERSARAAHTLMELADAPLASLGLDEELREAVDRARAITSHVARRREERRLAGVLRGADLDGVERRLAQVKEHGRADARQFQLAESWRERLIEEGAPAAEELSAAFPGADREELARLIEDARRERTTGRPRGAARALFRLVAAAMREREA